MKKYTTSTQIRQAFLDYFKEHDHALVSSSSLIPAEDPTLLFTNSGMAQFKSVFLGQEKRQNSRAVTVQRCIRASGKHNDLENVGYTNRHHTFFEMLGNFSFGDYFKKEAIHYAWEFLTVVLGIDAQKLWITVHEKDTETEKLWHEEFAKTNTKAQGLSYCGDKDNFWAMGDVGPCGYCSEIFYDHGAELPGDSPGGKFEGERYVEIWNLVFMQFERDKTGNLTLLPKPSIDTGMGLERITAVMQNVYDNYKTDDFVQMNNYFVNILRDKFQIDSKVLKSQEAIIAARVIADHIRSSVFLIAEGIMPSNERAGYVLRSIIRRASYYLYRLGVRQPFFFELTCPLLKILGNVYPELQLDKKQDQIACAIKQEEIKFLDTLDRGIKILDQEVSKLTDDIIPGVIIFNLHDTYGFPAILTAEIARARNLLFDQAGFDFAMNKQREASREGSKFGANKLKLDIIGITEFTGYEHNKSNGKIIGIFTEDGAKIEFLDNNQEGIIVLDKTCFYAESGGQTGDSGEIYSNDSAGFFVVTDTQKYGSIYLHYGYMASGSFSLDNSVITEINQKHRQAITISHSTTHLLHTALRMTLGDHVVQRGSLVDAKRLRFDFTHTSALTEKELYDVELIVNQQIRTNLIVDTKIESLEEAKKDNVFALFGEKYGDEVRVVNMGCFSHELCGGTHVNRTGDIGLFKIISETGVAAGVRRIEGVTGENALNFTCEAEGQLKELGRLLGVGNALIFNKLNQVLEEKTKQEQELTYLKKEKAANASQSLLDQVIGIGNFQLLSVKIDNSDLKELRATLDILKQKLKFAIIVLATITVDQKVQLIVGVTADLVDKIKANELLQHLVKQIDGSGGGRADMAQGGGINTNELTNALNSVSVWLQSKM